MSIPAAMGVVLGVLGAYMVIGWLLSLVRRDASIVDPFWGIGFIVAVVAYFLLTDGYAGRRMLVVVLAAAWGLRLSGYLIWRNRGKGEDPRYRRMRDRRPKIFWWFSLFQVFLLQALFLWLISAPLVASQGSEEPARFVALDFVGLAVWLVGFAFEVTGDTQLALFKRNPANKGKVLDRGVWRYTRHPNYFGDSAVWWAYAIFSFAAGSYWQAA